MRRLSTLVAALIMSFGTVVAVAGEAQAATSPSIYECLAFRPTLSVGTSQHACTAALQGFLRGNLQQPGLAVDGMFGTQTEKVVKKFQSVHSLAQDGVVGSNTWRAIEIECGSHGPGGQVICLTKWQY
jgi:murein L,D-transpeptidase YcbB/YkuD